MAQIRSSTEPPANLGLVEDYTKCADAGAQLVLFPEATMCRFGVPLARRRLRMRVPPPIPQPAIGSPVGWAVAGGNRPRSAIACGRCDRWWTGRNEAHCSACHETFTCIGAFDWHRRNGQCRKPPDVGLVVADRGVVRLESARHLERP